MAEQNETEVKIIDRVEVAPAEDNTVDEEKETPLESSPDETKEEETEEDSEESDDSQETPEEESEESEAVEPEIEADGDIKHVAGETPREYALRLEVARLKGEVRNKMSHDIFVAPTTPTKKELSPEKKKVLERYKPEDINTLKEVFDVMAEDMGFVRSDQLSATTQQKELVDSLDKFIDAHPEYQPKNDKDGLLWKAFNDEYLSGTYNTRPPTGRALIKILNQVHREVFGIKSTAALNKQEAAKEKIKVASHSSSSRPTPSREGVKRNVAPQGLRTDMLKGFSDEEIEELTS